MNITNHEIIQATLDTFFAIVCIVMVISIKTNNPRQKSMRMFMRLFLIAAVLFASETLAYVFRGNLGLFNTLVIKCSNLVVFAMNVAMANVYVRYVQAVISEKGAEINKRIIRADNVFSCINLAIIAVNLFYHWMYYFDENNYYHRNSMWYVYTVLTLVVIFTGAGVAIKYRKLLKIRSFIAVMLFSFIPIIATIVQVFIYGISITNLGLGIGSFIMFAAYIYDWVHDSDEQIDRMQDNRFDIIILFVIMLLSMSVSIIASGSVIQKVTRENSEMQSITIAQMVSAKIETEFIKPITVSQTISQDVDIINNIGGSAREDAEAVEDAITQHLIAIGNEFGYQMVFVASEKSKAYYTYKGISKYLDVENDSHDIWYKDFWESGKKYVLNVDTDEVHDRELSLFVNYGITGENGERLGICGTGVNMSKLMEIISEFEEIYDIKIDLVNRDGLAQVDSDISAIEVKYMDNSYFDQVTGTDFCYRTFDDCCYMTKYLEALDWYLIIRDNKPVKLDMNMILLPIVLIFFTGIIVMTITFTMISVRGRKAKDAYIKRYELSIKDELTGLYNRRGYEIDCEYIDSENLLSKYSVIMMDLNGLKAANDTIGHEAGDELLIGAAKCMSNAFSSFGNVYRVGGDEFVALLNCPPEKVEAAVKTLDYLTANYKGTLISQVSVSKGVVISAQYPELSFEEIKAMADKLMYADKDEYYRRTGKERRKI